MRSADGLRKHKCGIVASEVRRRRRRRDQLGCRCPRSYNQRAAGADMPIEGSRYVRAISVTSGPTRLVTAVPDLIHTKRYPKRLVWTTSTSWVWASYARRVGTRWHGRTDPTRLAVSAWWDWLDALTPVGGRLYVVAPIASDLLTLAGFWQLVESGRYRLSEVQVVGKPGTKKRLLRNRPWYGRLILRGEPDIIHCRGVHGSLLFCSLGNWCRVPLAELCHVHGIDGSGELYPDPLTGEPSEPAARQSTAIGLHMRSMIGAWVAADNGPWRETVGQLAQSLWRRKFYTSKVCRHRDPTASLLEDQACHGGRASVWYFGDVGDRGTLPDTKQPDPPVSRWQLGGTEAHRLDVKGMYPTLLRDRRFPTRLLSVLPSMPVEQFKGFVQHVGCIARVCLRTDAPEYPLRFIDRTRFPVGTFWTTLAGPELKRAAKADEIVSVAEIARYELGRPLKDVAAYLLTERDRCRAAKDGPGEALAKALAVSLGGKFAQRSDRWVVDPTVPPEHWWGEWVVTSERTAEVKRYRSLCGLVHRHERGQVGGKLLAALFCYLTAYGRLWMRDVRAMIGADNVLSQDTDGLWVTDAGLDICEEKGLLGAGAAGDLLYKESCGFARWLDARHYYHGGSWVLSGIKGGFTAEAKLLFHERLTTNPARGVPSEHPTALRTAVRKIDLRGIRPDVPVDWETGWARPWHVGPGRPTPWKEHIDRIDSIHDD